MTGFAVNLSNYFRACVRDLDFTRSGAHSASSSAEFSEYTKEESANAEMSYLLPSCISPTSLPSPDFRRNPRTDQIS